MQSNGEKWTEVIFVKESERLILFYAVFPESVPQEIMPRISFILMNENYQLINGAFELDYTDGDLRFRTSLLCPDSLNSLSFQQVINDHTFIMTNYLPAVQKYIDETVE